MYQEKGWKSKNSKQLEKLVERWNEQELILADNIEYKKNVSSIIVAKGENTVYNLAINFSGVFPFRHEEANTTLRIYQRCPFETVQRSDHRR